MAILLRPENLVVDILFKNILSVIIFEKKIISLKINKNAEVYSIFLNRGEYGDTFESCHILPMNSMPFSLLYTDNRESPPGSLFSH